MPASGLSPFASLRHRNFRLFFIGQTTSLVGTWMQTIAQGWLILQLTNSVFQVGLVSALSSLPVLLFSLPAGVYVDRGNKYRIILIGQILMSVQAVVLTFLVASHRVTSVHVMILATFMGMLNAIEIPARQSFFVDLVGKDDLTNAIALNSSAYNVARILGPAVAGVLIGQVGMAVCFGLNAASYIAVIGGLLMMKLPPWQRPVLEGDALTRFREGIRFARTDRRVWALIVMTAVFAIFGFPYFVLLPIFARDVLRVGPEGLGIMSAAVGVGAVAGAFGLAMFSPRVRRGAIVHWAGPLFGATVALFALAHWYPAALLLLALSGFAMVLNNAATNTLLQGIVPDALRGRVMSFWTFVFVGFAPIGSLEVGWLGERIGASWAVAIGGIICTVAAVWIWNKWAPEVVQIR
jgi:MFS family permease